MSDRSSDLKQRFSKMWARNLFASKRSRIIGDRDQRLVKQTLERYPEGYPRISAYIDSDVDTALFRRFGVLQSRCLLYRQVELNDLEKKLAELDQNDKAKENTEWRISNGLHHDNGMRNEDRRDLIEEIESKLEAYNEMLLRESKIRALPRPSKRMHRNFMDYIYTENPFAESDQDFIFHEHDFVSLEHFEESWLDQLVHRFMEHASKGIFRKLFVTLVDQEKTADDHVDYYSAYRVGALIKILVALASTALLSTPVSIFSSVPLSLRATVSITSAFIFTFATTISLCTTATWQAVFTATAVYCAVLVFIIGTLQQRVVESVQCGGQSL